MSFDISAYENDRDIIVTVASGSVSVAGPSVISKVSSLAEGYTPKEKTINTL